MDPDMHSYTAVLEVDMELFHLQSFHGLEIGEGSRDQLGDSVVVQKPEGEIHKQMYESKL